MIMNITVRMEKTCKVNDELFRLPIVTAEA